MNEKLSFQNIVDLIALKADISKKAADAFAKAFFDTITETLDAGDESVKVKGLGTFKLVAVGSRESVNVSNGERFVIPGYKKVAFTPEERVIEFLNGKNAGEDETPAIKETPAVKEKPSADAKPAAEEAPVVEEAKTIEELIQVSDPERVEKPKDAFAGIDMIISTPESVEEVRRLYEQAKEKMEVAVEEARKANAEKVRLEKLLERLEAHTVPESMEAPKDEKDAVEVLAPNESTENELPSGENLSEEKSGEEKRQEAFERLMKEPSKTDVVPQKEKKTKRFWTISIVAFVVVIGLLLYQIFRNIEAVEEVAIVEQPTKTLAKPKVQPVKPVAATPVVQSTKPSESSRKSTESAKAEQHTEHVARPVNPKTQPIEPKPQLAKPVQPTQQQDKIISPQKDEKKAEQKKFEQKKVEQKPAEKLAQKSTDKSAQKPSRPSTHVMQRGESLTRVSQKYYGTKDSVQAIIRKNKLKDPDNVPLGYVIKLP
ncbi:MAG: HU family DNA-binding protein [Bacteroidaceae bacterium]|nr:HU family DNA-binding protein [Bacteroidaceae bacterium]